MSHYAKNLDPTSKTTITDCLELIKFGMSNTLLTFQNEYYKCRGDKIDTNKRGLTIGGYESIWLADLAAAYVLDLTKNCFNQIMYRGLYRDDGIIVL